MNEALYSWSTTTKLSQTKHYRIAWATTCSWLRGKAPTRT